MSNLKLIYWNARGLAESTRYLLAYAGVEYEDFRIERNMWNEIKPTTPMGQVPVLEHNGTKICQSMAIARYVAKKFCDLVPENDFEAAQTDMMVWGLILDFVPYSREAGLAKWNGNDAKYLDLWNSFKMEHLPKFLDRYENILKQNNTGYLVGSKLTWADVVVAEYLNRLITLHDEKCLNGYQHLTDLMNNVHELPGIKRYVLSRPETNV